MKKFLVSTFFVVSFIANAFYQRTFGAGTAPLADSVSSNASDTPSFVIAQNTTADSEQPVVSQSESTPAPVKNTVQKTTTPTTKKTTSPVPTPAAKPSTPTPVSNPVPTPTPAPAPVPAPTPVVVPQGKFRNGTYTGSSADASYGIIQVKATIADGKLADVTFLSYPSDRRHSVQVNTYAMPILKQEAISAQSQNVDAVSGASYTSAAFVESLGSALSQAAI